MYGRIKLLKHHCGFITGDDGCDYFVYVTDLEDPHLLSVGSLVMFEKYYTTTSALLIEELYLLPANYICKMPTFLSFTIIE